MQVQRKGLMKRIPIIMFAVVVLASCKTTERVVTVPEVHDYHHWHTDSVKQTDSVIVEKETVVMQLDSAAMAAYGIRLDAAQQAWLVKTSELERALNSITKTVTDTVHERDSIPVPYPVEVIKEVPRELTWWQKTRMHGGEALLGLLGICGIYGLWRIRKKLPL